MYNQHIFVGALLLDGSLLTAVRAIVNALSFSCFIDVLFMNLFL